ncbi:hypothetical protein BASA61_003663 [Batrachochytrium salamandrivorans]|nr:hypothetical protein BASA62_002651 [Batrachochytrium salamandrivorans]KAH6595869.1 hypothetical protein BASA61_003663 [Batrachochytrium salamandrivorans]KAJ1332232.1 hypothetical protein BSLG_008892 [Batrachochytrium salamandrivorans]
MLLAPLIWLVATYASVSAVSIDQQTSQAAALQFEFFLQAPGNCLISHTDLSPSAPSKNLAALWIRAAFHDSGTWDPSNVLASGGPFANLPGFLNVAENAGLEDSLAPRFLHNTQINISKADSIALAGLVSVTHCGGPSIPYSPGRVDTTTPVSPVGRLPEGHERYLTVKPKLLRMGWTNQDIVALVTGSHTMGGVHGAISPLVTNKTFVPFDLTPGVFDNDVFKRVLQGICAVPVDCDIANDPELRPIVQLYATDQQAFFKQYATSFAKLISQGTRLGPSISLVIDVHNNLMAEGTTDALGNPLIPGTNGSASGKTGPSTKSSSPASLVIRDTKSWIERTVMTTVVWVSAVGILSSMYS